MKVYKVVWERENPTVPEEIEKVEEYFISEIIGPVFNVAITRASALDAKVIGVFEVIPSVTKITA